jgi:hypothetical protein
MMMQPDVFPGCVLLSAPMGRGMAALAGMLSELGNSKNAGWAGREGCYREGGKKRPAPSLKILPIRNLL